MKAKLRALEAIDPQNSVRSVPDRSYGGMLRSQSNIKRDGRLVSLKFWRRSFAALLRVWSAGWRAVTNRLYLTEIRTVMLTLRQRAALMCRRRFDPPEPFR